ncbi:unnamed protein product, partial [Rotaria sp. Silwood2]
LNKIFYIFVSLLILSSITAVALVAAALGIILNHSNQVNNDANNPVSLIEEIRIGDLLRHLEQLQVIADNSNGTRAVGTRGFNGTIDYITDQLRQNTNFLIQHQNLTIANYLVRGTPQLQSRINGVENDHVYLTDFTSMTFSGRANFPSFTRLFVIPNLGCQDADWTSVSTNDSVALVGRGNCTYTEKAAFAEKYRVKGLLIHNSEIAADNARPIQGLTTIINSTIPTFFLSYNLGKHLANATVNVADVGMKMSIDVADAEGVRNICADTPSGDKTKTILIGAHSDSVMAGSGIDDNGSGTVGILVLALSLARLFQKSPDTYPKYLHRIRFCWWGAEEVGLLGSKYHVEQLLSSDNNKEGERFQDYLLNLNYDMIAGPNYLFGIYDGETVPTNTPPSARRGTNRISNLFQQWFIQRKLPWTRIEFGGGSDYAPFLAKGLPVGGIHTGTSEIKTPSERDEYAAMLGTGNGGIANAALDPCYHLQCDRISNIDTFAYETVVKAAAYAIEYLGRMNNLEKWLYPDGRV